ncbi:cellulose binding domain-containing protein [Micromonospora sp. NPDC048930]
MTQSGTSVTARNVSWNGGLAPTAQTTWGFLASGNPVLVPLTCAPG